LYADVNVRGTAAIFEAARQAGLRKVVYASSSSVYGARATPPFREDGDVDHPVSPYAATKRACELLAHTYHHLYGMDLIGLRFFTVYGPRQRPDMAIHRFTQLIDEGRPAVVYGDGSAQRDFTYVDDIVQGVLAALDRARGLAIYNLGESATTSVAELIELIGAALGKTPRVERRPPEPGDVPLTFADIGRARAELGYDPQVPLREGLARFVAWRRSEPAL
jgi:UDP-glucuronate 4-epimerase